MNPNSEARPEAEGKSFVELARYTVRIFEVLDSLSWDDKRSILRSALMLLDPLSFIVAKE